MKKEKVVIEFTEVRDSLPGPGVPVLFKYGSTIQNIIYCLDTPGEDSDEAIAWFEPYHFKHDDESKILVKDCHSWAYLP